jgi:hypothetical protein
MEGWYEEDGTPVEWTWPTLRTGIQGAYNEKKGLDDDGDMANELQCMNCTTPEGGFNNYGWYVPARAPGRKRLSARASEASAKKVRASEASAKKTRDRSERSEANVSARGRSERKEGARGRSERSEANVSGARKRVATAGRRPSRERMCEAAVNKSSRKRAAILGFAPPAKEVL